MCGIAGFIAADGVSDAESVLERMGNAVRHRGPDAAGVWYDQAGVGMAHQRLSVLDLSVAGAQPMRSSSGRYVIAYNGEIYNHQALRREFSGGSDDFGFRGSSDTETLLFLVERIGLERTLQRIVGMFSFALWDCSRHQLTLVRDRLGEKPLYYGESNGAWMFGSEIGSLLAFPGFSAVLNPEAVEAYLAYSCVPAPLSIYRGIKKLLPGHTLTIGRSGSGLSVGEPKPYWTLTDVIDRMSGDRAADISYQDLMEQTEQVLADVVESQMLSDVPLGSFLSGGIDSSLVTALMQSRASQPVKTFSIGFSDTRFDESVHAKAVAEHLGTEHCELVLSEREALGAVGDLSAVFDEPFSDPSQLPTLLLSRMTREHVTVALSGDGGDELFGGYNRHFRGPALWRHAARVPFPVRRSLAATAAIMQRYLNAEHGLARTVVTKLGLPTTTFDRFGHFAEILGSARTFEDYFEKLIRTWTNPAQILLEPLQLNTCLPPLPVGLSGAEQMMAYDTLGYLPNDILVKLDRTAMNTSLEARAPFLDSRVIDQAWRLPVSAKIHAGQGKRILRDILYRHVPQSLVDRPKQGFAMPLDSWLRGPLASWASDLLHESDMSGLGVDREPVLALWQSHLNSHLNAGPRLWAILLLCDWYHRR